MGVEIEERKKRRRKERTNERDSSISGKTFSLPYLFSHPAWFYADRISTGHLVSTHRMLPRMQEEEEEER
jgi:hypothetical protein